MTIDEMEIKSAFGDADESVSVMAAEIRPWRRSPFVVGGTYRVRHSFKALRDSFHTGETLIYERDAYSRHEGLTGYFFSQPGRNRWRAWDISDDEDLSIWLSLFEEILPVEVDP